MMTQHEAKNFCDRWLPAWSGNQPEKLASFYSQDAMYSDPSIRQGVKGNQAVLEYFKKLLSYNPHWIWTHLEAFPMQDGFLNKWLAKIPVGEQTIECIGVCSVQFNQEGLIRRNEVYFDRSELIIAIQSQKNKEFL